MGYRLSAPNIGFIDFVEPVRYYEGWNADMLGDFDPSQE